MLDAPRDIVLCHPTRTAIGGFGGGLQAVPATDLGAAAIRATLARAGPAADAVELAVMGQVVQAGAGMNPARQAAIRGGLAEETPALTVNRVCGSGAQAIVSAAQEIALGHADIAVAGGMENMDLAPHLMPGARRGVRMGDAPVHDAMLRDGLHDAFSGRHSGWHTEDLVAEMQITREAQDAWAARSQSRFSSARDAGKFDAEIVPVDAPARKGTEIFARDEAPRPDSTPETLARLRPAFRESGTITAGNAPGLNAGASAMLVMDRAAAEAKGIAPLGRLVAWGVSALAPERFGIAPAPAIRQALARAGWRLSDLERVEINEAYAAVPLAVMQELGLAEDVTNPEGGAIAHGHPIGATGAILVTRALHAMRREGQRRAMVSLCIGGGQGVALALEAM
ncbi:acetyl-CoA C-acetyltransferase [Albimonas donghaensis]|uniref:Acetyl-CoA C-acetyltransferase n=1 Tax=Albimonas donghaensis TaxID=356660 RepID=A0A1H3FD91_9RHOB|nr:thiolase family protein [Albimonas donghaensis]SDX89053.1 acetyl-CoA C-acetyltransferase [Albimonas donghaensis]